LDNHGKVVAITCLLDDKPHDFTNEDQEVLHIIGQRIGMEIERKRNLEEKERVSEVLRLNEDRLYQATLVSGTGVFEQTYGNDSIYCSPELRTHFGWDADELVTTQTFTDSIYPDDRKRVIEAIRHAQNSSGNGLLDIDYRIFRRNGEVGWLATRSQTFFETDGDVSRAVRTVGAVRDITKKKLAEQEQRIFATAFQTQEGIIVTDANQIIVRVNQPLQSSPATQRKKRSVTNPPCLNPAVTIVFSTMPCTRHCTARATGKVKLWIDIRTGASTQSG